MRILTISTLYPPNGVGGAEITAHLLARHFIDRGHEVASASLAPDGVARKLTADGVRGHYVPLANLYWPLASPRPPLVERGLWHLVDSFNAAMSLRLGRIMDEERPDVVHAHNLLGFSVAAWWAAHRRGIPVVQTLHDYYLACPRSVMFRDGRNCDGGCLPCRAVRGPRLALSRIPHTVTAVSERVLDRLTAAGLFAGVRRRVVIRGCNGPDVLPPAGRAADRRRGAPAGGVVRIGYIGRLDPLKGVETLLEAAALLPGAAFEVSIAGSGAPDYVEALRAAAPANVRFLGFVKAAEFLGEVDLLVVPSIWEEPGARVVHEAYAHGVAVVASRVGGMPEMVAEGRTGYLFEPGDARALAATLERARGDGAGAGAMARACREESARYDLDRIAGEYMAVLAAAASDGRRAHGRRAAAAAAAGVPGRTDTFARIGGAAQRVPPTRGG